MRTFTFAALLMIGCSAPALANTETRREYSAKELNRIAGLTADHFRRTATVNDDRLEPIAIITTDKGFVSRGRFTDRVRTDNFLRALVDKASGATIFQLYVEVNYNFDWRNFSSASVLIDGRPQSLQLTVIARDVVTCIAGTCSYREVVAIPLTEAQVRGIASKSSAPSGNLWPYRLKAQNGLDYEDGIIPAEAAGLLMAVDAYRQGRAGAEPRSQP